MGAGDTITLPAPAGTIVLTDNKTVPSVGTGQVQYVSIVSGTADDGTPVPANAQGLLVSLGSALDKALDSILVYPRGANYANLTASGLVLTGAGKFSGIFVSSASATPTIKVWDNTSAATTVLVNTFTPVAGTFYAIPDSRVATGIYVTISGTVDCMVYYDPTTT